ncbi:MAG: hypothetical protein ABJ275_02465 [Maricaulaceae bacterium]
MSKLEKIHEVLAMKRSLAERDVAATTIVLQSIDHKIKAMEASLSEKSQAFFSGVSTDKEIGDAVMLEKWRNMTQGKISSLQEEKKAIADKLNVEKELLKKSIIKEDVINNSLKAKLRAQEDEYQENQSSSRLENWILSRS